VVRPRQVGSDLPSGVRRPDRAVSLRDVRDLPVQQMGSVPDGWTTSKVVIGGPREHVKRPVDLGEVVRRHLTGGDPDTGDLREIHADVVDEVIDDWDEEADVSDAVWEEIEKQWGDVSAEGAATEEMRGLTADEAFRQHHATSGAGAMAGAGPVGGMDVAQARVVDPRRPNVLDPSQLPPQSRRDPGMGTASEPGPDRVLDPYHDIDIIEELDSQGIDWEGLTHGDPAVEAAKAKVRGGAVEAAGLTADQAFRQHHAMAGGEPPREGRAHPERVPAPYEPAPPMSEEERKEATRRYKEEIEKIRRDNPGVFNPEARSLDSQMLQGLNPLAAQSLMAAGPDEWEEGDYGSVPWWDSVPGMEDLPEFEIPDDEGFLESLFSGVGGFLGSGLRGQQQTTLPYAQLAQAQLGAFENASTEEKLAIVLTGLAALSAGTGVGAPLVPPLLGGSALLNAVG